MKQLVYTIFITNNRVSFHLWQNESLIKYQKVLKYYDHDYSMCACERDKDSKIKEYQKDFNCTKSLTDDLVVTYEEIVDYTNQFSKQYRLLS